MEPTCKKCGGSLYVRACDAYLTEWFPNDEGVLEPTEPEYSDNLCEEVRCAECGRPDHDWWVWVDRQTGQQRLVTEEEWWERQKRLQAQEKA